MAVRYLCRVDVSFSWFPNGEPLLPCGGFMWVSYVLLSPFRLHSCVHQAVEWNRPDLFIIWVDLEWCHVDHLMQNSAVFPPQSRPTLHCCVYCGQQRILVTYQPVVLSSAPSHWAARWCLNLAWTRRKAGRYLFRVKWPALMALKYTLKQQVTLFWLVSDGMCWCESHIAASLPLQHSSLFCFLHRGLQLCSWQSTSATSWEVRTNTPAQRFQPCLQAMKSVCDQGIFFFCFWSILYILDHFCQMINILDKYNYLCCVDKSRYLNII